MNEGLIPRRYAKALYVVAKEQNVDGRIYDMTKSLIENYMAQPDFQSVLNNPYVSDSDKIQLLNTAAGAEKKDNVYFDFLKLLSQNHRLNMAREIALAYVSYYRECNRIYEVRVTSAMPMSKTDDVRLRSMIEKHLNGGTMEYSQVIDSSLIGGFTVTVGNERIDASIRNELKQLRLNLITK